MTEHTEFGEGVKAMAMTIGQAIESIMHGETEEQYKKRIKKIRRLANERDDLIDAIDVLGDDPRAEKKKSRLAKVNQMIRELR